MSDSETQKLSVALTIRAFELIQGSEFTREQVKQYLENYEGKYSQKIVEAGMGMLIAMRMANRSSLKTRLKAILGQTGPASEEEAMIEEGAKKILTTPGVRDEMRKLLKNGFRREEEEIVLPKKRLSPSSTSAKHRLDELIKQSYASGLSIGDQLFISVFAPLTEFRVRTIYTGKDFDEHYSSDGVLFELGCYLFTRADVYLFTQQPEIRNKVGVFLHGKFQSLFQHPLNFEPQQFADVINDRLEMYGRLVREDPNSNRVHSTISWAVHDTINNGGAPQCDVVSRVPRIDALNDFSFKTTLMHWEAKAVPLVHAAIDQVGHK